MARIRWVGLSLMLPGLRRHWMITVLVVAGVVLRALAIVADRPAILYVDSIYFYLNHLPGSTIPGSTWPSPDPLGYNMLVLQPVLAIGNLFTVVVIQHLLGVGISLLIYAIARRRGVRRWVAAIAAAPLLLDANQIYIEHMIMSDTLFEALLAGGIAALLWNARPGPAAIAAAGVLLGAATTVRAVGLPVLLAAVVYLLAVVRGRGIKALAIVLSVLSFAVPLLAYQLYATASTRHFSASGSTARTLYARAATFVDCTSLDLPDDERQLCPAEPLGRRHSPDFYANSLQSPIAHAQVPPGVTLAQLEQDFAIRAMTGQPLRLADAVLTDAARLFTWDHDNLANPDAPAERFRFQTSFPLYPSAVTLVSATIVDGMYGDGPPQQVGWAADFLRDYQLSVGSTPGPFLLLCVLAALGAICGIGKWRGAPNRAPTFLALGAAALVLGAADFYEFSWRYQLPALVLLPLAGILGASTIAYRPGDPAAGSGDGVSVADLDETFAGTPEHLAGTPEHLAGTPERAAGTPDHRAGVPEHPADMPGEPPLDARVDEQVEAAAGAHVEPIGETAIALLDEPRSDVEDAVP